MTACAASTAFGLEVSVSSNLAGVSSIAFAASLNVSPNRPSNLECAFLRSESKSTEATACRGSSTVSVFLRISSSFFILSICAWKGSAKSNWYSGSFSMLSVKGSGSGGMKEGDDWYEPDFFSSASKSSRWVAEGDVEAPFFAFA